MDKTALVDDDIRSGKRLIEELDKAANLNISAALWLFMPEAEEWRLVVASPLVEKDGPKKAYSLIQAVIKKMSPPVEISLKEISAVGPQYEIVKLLRRVIRTKNGISGIRFTHNSINNVIVNDAYIYLMR